MAATETPADAFVNLTVDPTHIASGVAEKSALRSHPRRVIASD
jgi:hypothetical protein